VDIDVPEWHKVAHCERWLVVKEYQSMVFLRVSSITAVCVLLRYRKVFNVIDTKLSVHISVLLVERRK